MSHQRRKEEKKIGSCKELKDQENKVKIFRISQFLCFMVSKKGGTKQLKQA